MSKNRIKKPLGPTKVCPYCNYGGGGKDGIWHSRVEVPKECPRCKRYLRNPAKDIILPQVSGNTQAAQGLSITAGQPGLMIQALLGSGPIPKE